MWHKKAFFRSSQKIHDVVFFNEKLTYCKTNETVFNQFFQKLGIPQGVTNITKTVKFGQKFNFLILMLQVGGGDNMVIFKNHSCNPLDHCFYTTEVRKTHKNIFSDH